MSNLFIWFASATERRDFILELLEIPRLTERNGPGSELDHLEKYLDLLDSGRTKSPYFNAFYCTYNFLVA